MDHANHDGDIPLKVKKNQATPTNRFPLNGPVELEELERAGSERRRKVYLDDDEKGESAP